MVIAFSDSEFDVIGSSYRIPPYRYRSSLETTPGKPSKTEIALKAFSTGRVASLCGANKLLLAVLPPLTTADSQEKTSKLRNLKP